MKNKTLIDTDILSEIRKGKNPQVIAKAIAYKTRFKNYTISVITVSEVIKGWRKLNRNDRIQEFLIDLPQMEILSLVGLTRRSLKNEPQRHRVHREMRF